MKTISILGSGWLGLSLARELAKTYAIKLSTTSKSKIAQIQDKNIEPYLINIESLNKNIQNFLDCDILIVNIPSKNVEAFSALVEKLKDVSIKKLIFTSSISVYKDCLNPIKENDIESLKISELLEIENLFLEVQDKEVTILRLGGLIGYERNLLKFFQNKIVQNSKARLNLIHRDDCIGIIKRALEINAKGIFNCCASTHPTKEDFYNYLASVSEYKLPQFDNKSYHNKVIDNNKLKEKFNYKFIYDDLLKVEFPK